MYEKIAVFLTQFDSYDTDISIVAAALGTTLFVESAAIALFPFFAPFILVSFLLQYIFLELTCANNLRRPGLRQWLVKRLSGPVLR